MAQLRVPVFHDIRRYSTDKYFDSTFFEVPYSDVLNNCGFYGRQKVLLSVTALATRRSFTGFAGKLPSSYYSCIANAISYKVQCAYFHIFEYDSNNFQLLLQPIKLQFCNFVF